MASKCSCSCHGCKKTFLSHCGIHGSGCHVSCGHK